jgi:hypothetical protein
VTHTYGPGIHPAVAAAAALREALDARNLPVDHARHLLQAFVRDATQRRYATWSDLMLYCSYSAAPVGRYLLDLHGESSDGYPASDALVAAFTRELAPYERSKGTIRIPLSEPVPVKLIERIARFRAEQLTTRETRTGGRKKGRHAQLERVRRICATLPSVSEKISHGKSKEIMIFRR